ncbi:MAG: tRNA dihydrouridine synthase DusB [Leptospiraceae bacterium]|nr:tRNA dihydrouridine synthase DusB [Leptospiraceae bacterium]
MINLGKFTIDGNIALSPMAGISDSPHRSITRSMGAAFSYTEFVSSDGISHHSKKCIDLFQFKELERPIIFQIFGNNKEVLTEASKIIEELEPDAIDLNMGCSTQKVSQRGSGAGLLKNPTYAGEIIESMVKAVNVPITAKIRIGWDESTLNYKEVVHILQESGVSMISVHGRTKSMAYSGRANWDIIGEIKSFSKVPILGNGDIGSYKEAMQRIKETGVDGVLIGRAAIGNPWIFEGRDKSEVTFFELKEKIKEHLQLMLDFYGLEHGLVLFRKHFSKYTNHLGLQDDYKRKMLTSNFINEYLDNLEELEKYADFENKETHLEQFSHCA